MVDEKAEWTRYNASDLLYLPILSNTSFMVQKGSMVEIRFDDDTTTSVPADTSWTYIEAPQDTLLSFSQEIDQ